MHLSELHAISKIITYERIKELFKNKGIPYTVFDPKAFFNHYNILIREDRISATPSCAIIK